ncbi:hypothetical protein HF086_001599 [Spodoptera exigua]|uniref:GPI transamidase component PIG-S n=1 Tax=Spodoptera exigua TaxID=7107 RepID=A0A922SJY8_SPOEX|nr:hypothetical protein HF086_001599 [Spodoptera exigua]
MWASASFVGVLIVIGLPLWWKTTEVYRVSLPYDKISSFDTLSHSITTELTVLANDEATAAEIIRQIEYAFKDSDVTKLKITKSLISKQLLSTLDAVADEHEAVEEVGAVYDLTKHNTFYVVQRKPLFQDTWLAGDRIIFILSGLISILTASNTVAEALKHVVYQTSVVEGARSEAADAARQTRFPPGAGYHIVLSVAHPRPDALKVELDADYIGSFVDELSVLHNFTLKSQWLHLLDFDFQAKELEERTATHVSELPTINLALYAVPCERAPLVIYDSDGEISNIVINDEVGASINSAVESIQRASELMARGDLLQAYNMSQSAFLAAETAFMEPSLLALLYFPDDQKYAIYIPLFLPIMFPVVLSLKNLLLWFRGKPIHKEKTE